MLPDLGWITFFASTSNTHILEKCRTKSITLAKIVLKHWLRL